MLLKIIINSPKIIIRHLVVITFFSLVLFGQTSTKSLANADIIEYTLKDGLPTSDFRFIEQTSDGYIWLSGLQGTFRFDGYEYAKVGEEYGVPECQAIYYDRLKDTLYMASPTKFIKYSNNKFKVYDKLNGYRINGSEGQVIRFLKMDSKNNIWIGSFTPYIDEKFNGGLTKFDNGNFTVYDSSSFPLHNANGFIETPYGDLIFSSLGRNTQNNEEAYAALYKNEKFVKLDESMGIEFVNINQFNKATIDDKGNTWISYYGLGDLSKKSLNEKSGVLKYDGNTFHKYPGLKKKLTGYNSVTQVYYDNNEKKVYVTLENSAGIMLGKSNETIFELVNNRWKVSDIFSRLINSYQRITNVSPEKIRYNLPYFINDANTFSNSLVFTYRGSTTSTDDKTLIFSKINNEWILQESFIGNLINSLLSGGIAIKTPQGISIYYKNESKMVTENDGLLMDDASLPGFYDDNSGHLWISYSYTELPTYAEINDVGINVWDGKKLKTFTIDDGLSSNTSFNILSDKNKRTWITSDKGVTLCKIIKNSLGEEIFKFKKVKNSKRKIYNSTNVIETSNGDIYAWQNFVRPAYDEIDKANFYLGKYDGNQFVEIKSPFNEEQNNKPYQIIKLRETKTGDLWLEALFTDIKKNLTTITTVIKIFRNGKWVNPDKSWEIPNEQLHYVGELDNGMYYLTAKGFYNFNGFKFINLIDSVNSEADFTLIKGASVVGTFTNIQLGDRLFIRIRGRGLVEFNGTQLKYYDPQNGLPSANIHDPILDNNGNLFFSSQLGGLMINDDGIRTFYDDKNIASGGLRGTIMDDYNNLLKYYAGRGLYIERFDEKKYPIKISSISINDKIYFENVPTKLEYSENSFLFNYAALSFKKSEQTSYENFLEGYDKGWSRRKSLSFAEYQNLPPGNFTFRVRASTFNGIKTDEVSYSFLISPPLWQTWWAYLFYVLFTFGILYSVRKVELKRQKKNTEIKESKLRAETAELQTKAAEAQAKVMQIENDRKTKELEEARQLQLSMLPKELPKLPNIDIAVYMKTATEVGGDYYDFYVHPDRTLTVVVGDATGHGMQSGMMVSIMKSLFMSDRSNKELKSFFNTTNESIKDMHLGRLMMALTCIQINGSNINIANAGMPPVYFYNRKKREVEELEISNMPLGAIKKSKYDILKSNIEKGDTLLLLSDGLPEIQNDKNEMFGYTKVKNCFREVAEKSSEEIIDHLKEESSNWLNGNDPNDDVTFVVIKVK